MNVVSSDVLLYPRTVVGGLSKVRVVSLPASVDVIPSYTAIMASQVLASTVPNQIDAVDLCLVY